MLAVSHEWTTKERELPARQTQMDDEKPVVKRHPSMFVSALSNWLPLSVNILIGLLLTPFLIAQLGKKDYGIWALTVSFVGYYGLLRLSVGAGIMRYVPFYAGRGDHEAASQVVSTGLAMFTVVGAVILLVSTMVAGPTARFYKGGHELAVLVWIMGIAAAVECPMRIFDAALRARERWTIANVIAVANAILYAAGLVACLLLGYGLTEMGCVVIVSALITLILGILTMRKVCPELRLSIRMVKLQRLRELLTFGVLTVIGTMAYSLALQNHRLIIGKLVSLEAVGVYAVAALLIEKVRSVVWAPLQVSWPRFALLDGGRDYEGVTRLFHKTTRYSAILASWAVLLVLVAGPPFIRLWVGGGFEAAGSVLVVLGIGCLVESSLYANGSLLGGTGRQGMVALFAGIEAIGGFTLSILLGRKMGMVGVAWGFTVFVALIRGLICSWYVCRLLRLNLLMYFAQTLLRPWLILVILVVTGYMLQLPTHVDGWLSWLSLVCILTGLYGLPTALFVLTQQERQRIVEKARQVRARVEFLVEARK
jgi:membrane protein EpsK